MGDDFALGEVQALGAFEQPLQFGEVEQVERRGDGQGVERR
ncbi:hypothetical protein SDC9_209845 [bioreactor metagenome]|uniref:Uncharacterized protein n=1 Tax=bioreactor metagenome TaxID=1076179 RepID=A0A645JHD0_9ZZZZ